MKSKDKLYLLLLAVAAIFVILPSQYGLMMSDGFRTTLFIFSVACLFAFSGFKMKENQEELNKIKKESKEKLEKLKKTKKKAKK